jgi:hypothetical protein
MPTTERKRNDAIRTTFDPKPIPPRQFDWSAVRDDYEPGDLIGYGKTKTDAISDLIEQEDWRFNS